LIISVPHIVKRRCDKQRINQHRRAAIANCRTRPGTTRMNSVLDEIRTCVIDIRITEVRDLVKKGIDAGIPAYQIFTECITKGMGIVGQKYEDGEYFLSELLGAAEVVNEAMTELGPKLQDTTMDCIGKVVLGTVRGDMHDIGKNIVKMLMTSAGFEVFDLGVDTPPEKFVEMGREVRTNVLAMSALLTTTMGEMKIVMDVLQKSGLRDSIKVIIGGAPISDEYAREIGADAAAKDAAVGVRICKEWVGKA